MHPLTPANWQRLPPSQLQAKARHCLTPASPGEYLSRRWQRELQRRSGLALPRKPGPAAPERQRQIKDQVQTKRQVRKPCRKPTFRPVSFPLAARYPPSGRWISRRTAWLRPCWRWRRHWRRSAAGRWHRHGPNYSLLPGRQARGRAIVCRPRRPTHRPRGAAMRIAAVPLRLRDRYRRRRARCYRSAPGNHCFPAMGPVLRISAARPGRTGLLLLLM